MEKLRTIKDAAAELGLSESFLYQLVDRRRIECFRPGRRILFSEEQLQDYLVRCRQVVAPGERE